MNIEFDKRFAKDFKVLPTHVQRAVLMIIDEIKAAKKLFDVKNCIKMRESENLHRIRTEDYRIILILYLCGETVEFIRVLSRGQVYKKHNKR
ncbi:MAG: hypothetical protein FWF54_00085 [Candidatus Azobacteroides sp.]|nr:hypothetical protein [Candidatus Azobacteroides sp.]